MTMMISAALPVRNGANHLREALQSLVMQGPELTEIVVSDNCSDDGTLAIAESFAARDPRVRIVTAEAPLEQGDNVSKSVRLCRGKWVQILCHDDVLLPGAIEQLARIISRPEVACCAFIAHRPAHLFADGHVYLSRADTSAVEKAEDVLRRPVPSGPEVKLRPASSALADSLRAGTFPYLPSLTTAAVNREIFEKTGGFDSRWVHFDIFKWIRLMQCHASVVVEANWTLTRVHSAQVAVASRRSQRSYRDFRDFMADFLPEAVRLYALPVISALRLRLKPASQASAPIVVALRCRKFSEIPSAFLNLPLLLWPLVSALSVLNYYREGRRNAVLWKSVPPEITYE